jgi:membrane-associated progesterone receptor component
MLPVWVEMLLYAAEHCSLDSHARNLAKNNGGEFITILWLVFKYHVPPVVTASKDLIRLKEAEEEEEGIGEEELKQYDGSDPTKPLLMAIKGKIYDVTESRSIFYTKYIPQHACMPLVFLSD